MLLAGATISLCYEFWPFSVPHSTEPVTTLPAKYNPRIDPEFQKAEKLRKSGHLVQAVQAFDRLSLSAHTEGNIDKEARILLAKGSSQLRSFEYRQAAGTYFRVIELAKDVQDFALLGAAYVNVAEIHVQLGDLATAEREARQAVDILRAGGKADYLTQAQIQLGSIEAGEGRHLESIEAYRSAIILAENSRDIENEARAWTILGDTFARIDNLDGAEWAFLEAYRLGVLHHDPALVITRAKLAELEWMKGNPAIALRRLDAILQNPSPELAEIPQYQILYRRAQMLAALSRDDDALRVYRLAVRAASRWREGALPGEAVNADSVEVIHSIFADASDFAANLAVQRSDGRLRRESLEILAANRAADLRERRTLAWQQGGRLPAEYYRVLDQLRTAEASAILTTANKREDVEAKIARIRADLELFETRLSVESEPTGIREKTHRPESLFDIQQGLAENDVLLSFSLGKQRSWLWVVTRQSLNLFQLAPGADLERQSAAWAAKVRSGEETESEGLTLSKALFGQLPSSVWKMRNWLVVPDGALFANVPLAELPVLDGPRTVKHAAEDFATPLIQAHTIRSLASEYSLGTAEVPDVNALGFAGVGDPIYNLADSRLTNVHFDGGKSRGAARGNPMRMPLGRLVGSGREVRSAAAIFPEREVLTGADASTERVRRFVEQHPAIIHFAVHVISPEGQPENAALALTLGRNLLPELLTPELIATFRVPGSLVVMSGCDSQQGKAVPGVGVRGLSRAWLLAGASAVVASTWPTPDDGGFFFNSFYHHLSVDKRLSAGSVPQLAAAALAEAQNDMRNASGYRQAPSFWAAYTVMSKE